MPCPMEPSPSMTSPIFPIPPRPPDRESQKRHCGLSPLAKILLAGSIITLGLTVAGFQLRSVHESLDSNVVGHNPGMTWKESVDRKETDRWDAPIIMKTGENSGTMSRTECVAKVIPASPVASPDHGTGKYAQAYPKPVLEPDDSLKRSLGASETIEIRGNKPMLVTNVEFKPLHQIPVSGIVKVQESRMNFQPKPTAVPTRQTFDALLPLFHFAASASHLDDSVMPDNPFGTNEDRFPVSHALVPLLLIGSETSGQSTANKLMPLIITPVTTP